VPKIKYVARSFKPASLELIGHANAIIAEYQAAGFVLTLRQLYYQFVARDLIPNTQRSYKNLGAVVNDARLAGLIDWEAIEDRTRNLRALPHWEGPQSIVEACASQFRFDLWADQDWRPEVWIEKDALAGVFEGVCNELRVPYFAARGYNSQSEQWAAGMRLKGYCQKKKTPVILHFGDHDPSGLDMTRDNATRLRMFMRPYPTDFRRIALNMVQVEEYGPPPNPAKTTDSRYAAYIREYGESSWELDALDPATLAALVRAEIEALLDPERWAAAREREESARARLAAVADRWDEVTDRLEREED